MAKNNIVSSNISDKIAYALSIASLAPSVHNIQPWKVKVGENSLQIIPQLDMLPYGDATNRQTYISIGAFVQTLVYALESIGLKVTKIQVEKSIVRIKFQLNTYRKTADNGMLNTIAKRRTNRSIFKEYTIPKKSISEIKNVKINHTQKDIICRAYIADNKGLVTQYARLIAQAIKIPMLSPSFTSELSNLIIKKGKTGILYSSMHTKVPFHVFRYALRKNLLANYISKQELKNWSSSSVIVSICANGDSYRHWIEAGRLYQAHLLKATELGYSSSTSAALVEALDFHNDIEKMLETELRLLASIRIGKASTKDTKGYRQNIEQIII